MTFSVALAAFLIGFNKAGVAGTLGPFVTVLLALSIPADDAIGLLLPILIVADWFKESPEKHPQILIWLPNIVFVAIGLWRFRTLARK